MKVVQINSVCGTGSTGRIAVDISKKLNDEGIENYIFYGLGNSNYENGIKFGGNLNIRTHQLGTRLLGKHGFYSKMATKQLVDKIKEIDPHIIHLHNIHGHYLNVEILFNYLASSKKKVIWTLHDCWSFTGHCAHFDYIGCNKWKDECLACPQLREYPKSLIFDRSNEAFYDKKRLFNSVKDMTIVTPSHWLANLVSESFLQNHEVKVINNGIDLNIFKPTISDFKEKHEIKDKYMILGVAAIWGEKKGLEYFIDLSKKIQNDEVIVLVGLSKEQRRKLPKNIIGISSTNSVTELAEIYSCADVFVNLTLEDTFPTTNLEALACGTPVITFDTGGSAESISKDTGVAVEKGNMNRLKFEINLLKKKGKQSFYKNCILRANNLYNMLDKFEEYINLYTLKNI